MLYTSIQNSVSFYSNELIFDKKYLPNNLYDY